MELKIRTTKTVEKTVKLKITQGCWGGVIIYAKGEDESRILEITENGELSLYRGIDKDIGLQLDSEGRIKLED